MRCYRHVRRRQIILVRRINNISVGGKERGVNQGGHGLIHKAKLEALNLTGVMTLDRLIGDTVLGWLSPVLVVYGG